MKFKMPRNSIFAVLLRSPWWISAAIAALLSVGGFAALPLEYAAMGVFAAIPFAVIAIMAAWKLRAPSETRVQAVAQAAAAMSWTDFSRTVQAGFQRDGCEVERLQAPGADFALSKDGHVAIVGARRWKAARVGVEPCENCRPNANAAARAKPSASPWAKCPTRPCNTRVRTASR